MACHSDVSALDDPNWSVNFPDHPIILGHEPAGVVCAWGRVPTWSSVTVSGFRRAPPNLTGYFRDGAYAEKTTAIADAVVKIPEGLDFINAASGTDAGNVAYHAVVTRGEIKAGEKVAIVGIGGLGQFAARIAVLTGAEVYAAEVKEDVWPMARELGVVACVKDVRELVDLGLDAIVDFAGFGTTTMGALEAVRDGGRVIQVGMGKLVFEFNSNPLIVKQIDLKGSMGGGVDDLAGVYAAMAAGQLTPKITPWSFDRIPEGLDELRRGAVQGRIVVDMQGGG